MTSEKAYFLCAVVRMVAKMTLELISYYSDFCLYSTDGNLTLVMCGTTEEKNITIFFFFILRHYTCG